MSFINHNVNHAITHAHNPIHRIAKVFLSFNQENRTIIKAVAPIIKTVQKSGMSKKMKYSKAFKIIKVNKKCDEFMSSFFLISQLAKNITYASLKNSEGWILGICGILSHHLAQL